MKAFFGSSQLANLRTVSRLESLEALLYSDTCVDKDPDTLAVAPISKRDQAKLESSIKFLNQRKNAQAHRALDRMRSTRVAKSAAAAVVPAAPARARRGRGAAVRSSAASGDSPSSDESSDGEPPRPRIPSQLYSYKSAAVILDCSVQTLYNQVNIGRIPAPLKTSIGPRFSQEQLEQIIAGVRPASVVPVPVPTATAKKAGRPRLYVATTARAAGKVGAA